MKGAGPPIGDESALEELTRIAAALREAGHYFGAGYAMEAAKTAAWGKPDVFSSCMLAAREDYAIAARHAGACSTLALVALLKQAKSLWSAVSTTVELKRESQRLLSELAHRTLMCHRESEHADAFLVRGAVVRLDLLGQFEESYPDHEVDWYGEIYNWHEGYLEVNLPSAFHLFIYLGDYAGAESAAKGRDRAFITPSLRGWRAAARGFLNEHDASGLFAEASAAFAEDKQPTHDELIARGGSWRSQNVDLWAPYFAARSNVALASTDPGRVREHVHAAAAALPDLSSGWQHPTVVRFAMLIESLDDVLERGSVESLREAQERLTQERRRGAVEGEDELLSRFFTAAIEGLSGFREDPGGQLARGGLKDAVDLLSRVALLPDDFAKTAGPAIGSAAIEAALADREPIPVSDRTWVQRSLEQITDETKLQLVLLRLLQASLPRLAQVTHGAFEFGKDVIAVTDEDGKATLRMYQVKVGDIGMPEWRQVRSQLEEMFLAEIPDVVTRAVDARVGYLLTNGHFKPSVFPTLQNWFDDQRNRGRDLEYTSIDDVANWIYSERLVSEFQLALAEIGLEPV